MPDRRFKWHTEGALGPVGGSERSTSVKARARYYYRKERGIYVVYLYWGKENGRRKKWTRHTFDHEGIPLVHEVLAKELVKRINKDISVKGASFDPRRWFNLSYKDYHFKLYAERWLDKREAQLAPSYFRDVKRAILKYCVPFFGEMNIRVIRAADIEDFLYWLPQRLSLKTKKNILGVLHKLLADAWRREDIDKVPPFPQISIPESEIKWLPSDVQLEVIAAIPEVHRPIFKLMAYYGLRPGEARALHWEDISWETETISIKRTFSDNQLRPRTKTGRIKYLPLTEEAAEILKPIRGIAGFVFRNEFGKPYRKQRLQTLWNEAIKAVNAPKVTLYQGVRHSKGCQLINERGADIEHVKELLGHTRSDMTRRYARVSAGTLRKLLE